MIDIADTPENMARARRNVIVLIFAQAILGAQMSMNFIIGGLAGQMLAPNLCLATLPVSMIVLASALTARPMARFMQNHGRRAGFLIAVAAGGLGGLVSASGLWIGNFWVFTVGTTLTGIYMCAQGFYRFAATDTAPASFQPKAISRVMAGGLASAIVGPLLVRLTNDLTAVPYMATYAAVLAINLTGPVIFAFLDIPRPAPVAKGSPPQGRTTGQLLRDPRIVVAMICGMVSYALMNLVMTSAPLAIVGCGFETDDAANVVSLHVLAMFLPSFITGRLIQRFGAPLVVATGLVILTIGGGIALTGVDLAQFYATLILLGVGWNFGYIGATTMVTQAHSPAERGRVQGINDLVVFTGVFLASLASGGLMNCSGAIDAQAGWSAVNLAMVPFLILAGGALIWLVLRPAQDGSRPA